MILYFRLFAGLMSLLLNLCCSHFCESGPDGTLEFKVAMLLRLLSERCDRLNLGRGFHLRPHLFGVIPTDDAQVNRNRNQCIPDEDRDARELREALHPRPPDMISEAERLKHR